MSTSGSVTAWIVQLQAGEETALQKLHARYWPQLVGLARRRLQGKRMKACDEEDIAQEAFWSFYRRFRSGWQFRLDSRNDLLALLTHIIACKAINKIQHEYGVQKRGGSRCHDPSTLDASARFRGQVPDLAQIADQGPTPLEPRSPGPSPGH
jgi:DNA-directed RNA polymerase specialized sigma24 family protein